LFALALVAAMGALWLLLYPLDFQADPVTGFLSEHRIPRINTLSNVLLFVPLGAMCGWIAWRRQRWLVGIIVAIGVVAALSLLGEWLQVWLPDRQSSLTDVIANTLGGFIGAVGVRAVAPALDHRYAAIMHWLSPRPAMRWAMLILLAILAAKAAPFDVSVETFYIRQTLYQTRDAGLPFNQTWRAARADLSPLADAKARRELLAATLNALLMAAATAAISLAIRESLARGHDRTNPAPYALILGCIFAVVAELSQGLVRSRVMDGTDIVAGLGGVLLAAIGVGVVMAVTMWRRRGW
jgi:glycopeptide antibiotics resistance protein